MFDIFLVRSLEVATELHVSNEKYGYSFHVMQIIWAYNMKRYFYTGKKDIPDNFE